MNLRKLLIPAILLTLVGGTVQICDTLLNVYGNGFFMNSRACHITVAVCFLLLYLIGFVFSMTDRKKNFHAEPSKNFLCGAFGFLAAVMITGIGVVSLLTFSTSHLVGDILAILAGLLLLYESCISFTGQNGLTKLPILALLLPAWSCIRFIYSFKEYTQRSLHASELFDIIEIGFLIMFLFYQAMFFAGINNKVAVRRSVVYGTVFMMLALIVPIDMLIKMSYGSSSVTDPNVDKLVVEANLLNIMTYIGDLALCGYAFFFTREILKTSRKNLVEAPEDTDDENDVLLAKTVSGKTEPKGKTEVLDLSGNDQKESGKKEKSTDTKDGLLELMEEPAAENNKKSKSEKHEEKPAKAKPEIKAEEKPAKAKPEIKAGEKAKKVLSQTEQAPADDVFLPKVAEPVKTVASSDEDAYAELFDMLDNMEK